MYTYIRLYANLDSVFCRNGKVQFYADPKGCTTMIVLCLFLTVCKKGCMQKPKSLGFRVSGLCTSEAAPGPKGHKADVQSPSENAGGKYRLRGSLNGLEHVKP